MADLSLTAASVIPGTNAIIDKSRNAGATITAGKAVYLDATTNKYGLADCNSATAGVRQAKGIALNGASDGQPIAVQTGGDITLGAATLTAGVAYYLSGTAGGIRPVADNTTGDYPCLLGMAKTTAALTIDIQYPNVAL